MLKRYQVLLNDWQEKYVALLSRRYDLSVSSVLRLHISLAILYSVNDVYPGPKPDLNPEELQELANKAAKNELKDEEIDQLAAKIHLEARKAVERVFALLDAES
jgi:hypothetical protein